MAELQRAPTTAMGLDTLVGRPPLPPRSRPRWPLVVGVLSLLVMGTAGAWSVVAASDDKEARAASVPPPQPVVESAERARPLPLAPEITVKTPTVAVEPQADPAESAEPSAPIARPPTLPAVTDEAETDETGGSSKGTSGRGGRDCSRAKKQAHQAREHHDWQGVLRYTAAKSCWSSATEERLTLRTKASMELEQWDACIASGSRLSGSAPAQWVRICTLRRERGT